MSRRNWTQEQRLGNLEKVRNLLKESGGLSGIILRDDMSDFEKYVSANIGCSILIARDYITTLKGASIYAQKILDRKEAEK